MITCLLTTANRYLNTGGVVIARSSYHLRGKRIASLDDIPKGTFEYIVYADILSYLRSLVFIAQEHLDAGRTWGDITNTLQYTYAATDHDIAAVKNEASR